MHTLWRECVLAGAARHRTCHGLAGVCRGPRRRALRGDGRGLGCRRARGPLLDLHAHHVRGGHAQRRRRGRGHRRVLLPGHHPALRRPAVVPRSEPRPRRGTTGDFVFCLACLALAGAVDAFGIMRSKGGEYATPGDLGFDPIGAYPKSEDGRKWMETAEIKNGRLAMVAIFAFAIQEAVSQVGVVNETPLFFFPLVQTLKEYANSGYIN